MSIVIKGVTLNRNKKDIFIRGNSIQKIDDSIDLSADIKISGDGKAAIPSFINGHTHAAMTLLRGYADDMHLQDWLEKKIWVAEAQMTEEDIYYGARDRKSVCRERV